MFAMQQHLVPGVAYLGMGKIVVSVLEEKSARLSSVFCSFF